MGNGAPRIVTHKVPAERCEPYAHYFREKHPSAIVWSPEMEPPKPSIGDHIPRDRVEYLPDAMDMLGMPTER
jgi:hypothetical protein